MSFRTFSYTRKNRFDYPKWRMFVTFMFGFNLKRLMDEPKVRCLVLPLRPFAMMFGYKSYYTWNETKRLGDKR